MVEYGRLHLTLPYPEKDFEKVVERLHVGSSVGVDSILRQKNKGEGHFKFKVGASEKASARVYIISLALLDELKNRYPKFNR